ncbi:RagB/SusD family nutrient uptake outer membrane protein [Hyunsoonleella sp. SJ7]|uniref:RagB/SusD family nutrient uptake outer membrane protein n=1 Tax=Hyunsoonleella aquatilis TaxID=2762758 RepID=A0A923HGQ6_9FLAO|nr:RagB/SusD family nutrient uptake outer membrane protein [Hyunsoonleella aquatilis]MBC3758087.1 RagB/SusD family nutrient uptake outer membrane protein [Hyunsoonleella aquatilis]
MKTFISNKIITVLTLATVLWSCSKEFLDEPRNTAGLPESVVFSDREIVQSFVSGIYARYKGQWDDDLTDGVNNSNTDTGGLYAMYYARTVKGNDVIQAPSWFLFDYAHENRSPTFRRTSFTWTFNYEIINYANVIINGVESSPSLDEATKKEFIALGKAIRAFHYFQLALEFAPNYNNDRSVARIPIYTKPATGASEGNAPSPLSDVYNMVLSDLKDAIQDLPEERLGKSYINKTVANGILARVLQVTQDDWALASSSAREAYGGDASIAVASTNWGEGFDDLTDQDWLWGMFQDGSNETNFFWLSPHAMFDHMNLSYNAAYINTNFRDTFSDTDVRKLFQDFYGSSTPYREFITTKFNFTFASDVPFMRKSEMVLVDAEAQYRLGDEGEARSLLFALQSARDPNATMSTNSGNALLQEILLERRKELYGEMGVEWFDAKRLRMPINRDAVHRVVVNVPADSELFYLTIPQSEIDANPNMDDSINQ